MGELCTLGDRTRLRQEPLDRWGFRLPPNLRLAIGLVVGSLAGLRLGEQSVAAEALWLDSPLVMTLGWLSILIAMGSRPWIGLTVFAIMLQVARADPEPNFDRSALQGDGVPVTARVRACTRWDEGPFSRSATCRSRTYGRGANVQPVTRWIRVTLPLDVEEPPTCARLRGRLRSLIEPRNRVGRRERTDFWTLTVKSGRLVQWETCGFWIDRWSSMARVVREIWRRAGRAAVADHQAESRPDSQAWSLARAMWTGDRALIGRDIQAGFANWGLAHLLAASGLHVGVILGFGALVLGGLSKHGRWLAGAWIVSGTLLLLLSVGPRPSILRALCMTFGVSLSIWTRRPSRSLGHLGFALAVSAALRPDVGADLGALLSFSATAGVVVFTPRLARAWTAVPRPLAWSLAATVSAQLATAPFSLRIDPVIPLGAPLANLVAAPMAAWTLLYGCAGFCLAAFDASRPDLLARLFETPIEVWLGTVSGPPIAGLQPLWWGGSCSLLLWCGGLMPVLHAPRRRCWFGMLLVGLLFLPPSRMTEASFLDVGQGDATLLRSDRRAILVDGGGWRGGSVERTVLLPVLARSRIGRLEAVLLTHGDVDHCLGLLDLSRRFPIGELWVGGASEGRDSETTRAAGGCDRELRRRFEGRVRRLQAGDRLAFGRWNLEVLLDGTGGRSVNDRSVVVGAASSSVELLLTGDIEDAAEARLSNLLRERTHAPRNKVRILKVAHHGSRTSTTSLLLDVFEPDLAVISAGRRNVYGHPAPVVLARLEDRATTILRTDRDGRVDLRLPARTNGSLCFNTAVAATRTVGDDVDDEDDRERAGLVAASAPAHPCHSRADRDRQDEGGSGSGGTDRRGNRQL